MHKKKIAVAMSGGVDSSVAAAFLKNKGFDIVGLTMTLGHNNKGDIEDARRVASILGIPHHVVSLKEEFNKHVISYFVEEYHRGRTPNPCAICNPTIKFGALFNKARDFGADYIATGHYAIINYSESAKRYILQRGKEKGKDQSYFLSRLSQKALSITFFPVGTYTKDKIRALADEFGLPVAEKKGSQEACFIINESVTEFLKRKSSYDLKSGKIIDTKGDVLGTHNGIESFTIGQRKGLGIAVGRPIYVTSIDADTGTVFVGDNDNLYKKKFRGENPNWIAIPELYKPMRVETRIRYMHKPQSSTIKPMEDGSVIVEFDEAQRAITPGQLGVFYDKDTVIGSAWIDSVLP